MRKGERNGNCLDRPGRSEGMADHSLDRSHRRPRCTEHLVDRLRLSGITGRGGGAVAVYVGHVRGRKPRIGHCELHAAGGSAPVRRRGRYVVRIRRAGGTGELRIDVRPPGDGAGTLLEHDHSRALTYDEAVTTGVEGHGDAGARKGGHVGEARDAEVRQGRFGAAGDHHVASAHRDQPACVRDALGARRTGRDGRLARTSKPVPHGNIRRRAVAHHHRHQEWANPVSAFCR